MGGRECVEKEQKKLSLNITFQQQKIKYKKIELAIFDYSQVNLQYCKLPKFFNMLMWV